MRIPLQARRAWPYAALVAAAGLFFWRVLFGGDVLAPGYMQRRVEPWASEVNGPVQGGGRGWDALLWDDIGQVAPWRLYAARTVRAGEVPLWNPHQFCGTPFLANAQSAVFYPPNLLLWLLRAAPLYCLGLTAALHYLFAGVCTFALLRRLRAGEAASLLAALGFMFGGFMVTWTLLPAAMNTASWLPFCVLMAHKLFDEPRWSRAAWLGLGLAMAFLAGHPQIFVYVFLATAVYCVARLVGILTPAVSRADLDRSLRMSAGLLWIVTGGGLWLWLQIGRAEMMIGAAVGWLGYLLVRGRSVRVGAPRWERASTATCMLCLALVLTLLLPALQGLPTAELATRGHRGMGRPTEKAWSHPYAGQPERALRLDELVTLLAPNARGTPVKDTYKPERVTDSFTEKCGFVGAATLLLALAAPFIDRRRHTYFFAALSATALLIAMATPIGKAFYFHVPGAAMGGSLTRVMCVFTFSTAVLGGLGLDGLLKRAGACEPPRARQAFASAIAGIVVVGTAAQLFIFGMPFNATTPRGQLYARTETIRELLLRADEGRVLGITRKSDWGMTTARRVTLPPNSAMVYGLRDVNGYDSLSIGRYRRYARAMESMLEEAEDLQVVEAEGATVEVVNDEEASGGKLLRVRAEAPEAHVVLELRRRLAHYYSPLWLCYVRTPSSGAFLIGLEGEEGYENVVGYSAIRRRDEAKLSERPWWNSGPPHRLRLEWPGRAPAAAGRELCLDSLVLGRQPSPPANGNMVLLENVDSPLLRAASVRCIATQELLGGQGRLEAAVNGNTHLYEVMAPVPRVYVCTRTHRVADDEAAINRLQMPDWTPEKETVIIAPPGSDAPKPRLDDRREGHHRMPVTEAGPNELSAELPQALSSIGSYALVTDAIYPGWRAFVEGKEQPLFAANYMFRATYVPSGKRHVTFVYLPASFKVGAFISLLATAVFIGVVVLSVLQRRRRG